MDFLRLVIKVPRVIPNENPRTNDNKILEVTALSFIMVDYPMNMT